jgi:hypothetical protein
MPKNVKFTKEELLHACWGQFDGRKTGLVKKGGMRLRDPDSVDEDVLTILNTGRICTIEEMAEWVGPPCVSYAPDCPTCDSWADWHSAFRLLHQQHKFRQDMRAFDNEHPREEDQ